VQLAAHYTHSSAALPDPTMTYPDVLPQLIHVTYATGEVRVDQCCSLRRDTTTVVAVCHDRDHYGVLEIDLKQKKISIYDGLNRDLDRWLMYVFYALKRCMLCPVTAQPKAIPDKSVDVKKSRRTKVTRKSIEGYKIDFSGSYGSSAWRYERGHFIHQVDGFNCGPIACVKILEIFGLATRDDLWLGYQMGRLREVVKQYWERFINRCSEDMTVRVRELRAISEPPQTTSTSPEPKTVLSAAATVSSNAEIDPDYLCFCYCDSADMDILRLECCQNTVHRQCFIAHLMNFTQCPYCQAVVDDVAPFLECAAIERSSIVNKTPDEDVPMKNSTPPTTTPTTPAVKRNLEEMLVIAKDDNTPLRHTDVVHSESQEKKREGNKNRRKR